MDKKLAFQVLGIAETKEEDKIRQEYLSLLKDTNPEDDPEGFKRLREAYEAAWRFASERGEQEQEQEPQGEVEIWMKRVRETYRDIFRRNDIEEWKELFEEQACIGFDTFLDARSSVLGFLSGHYFLPRTVWQLLDRVFHVLEDFDALKEEFHVNFLHHIEYHVNTDDFLDYSLFEAKEDYGPEDDEEIDHYILEFFEIRNKLEEGVTEGVEQALADITRHGLYHPYEEVERLRLYIRLEESEKGRELAESLLARFAGDSYVQIWTGKIFSDAGDEERGFALWQAVLDKEPAYYMARYFALGYLMRQKQWFKARKYVNELLKVNSQDEELRENLNEINTELLPMVQEAYEKGEGFEDIEKEEVSLFLGRSLYNMERFDEVMALLEKDSELLKKGENALNLKTWTLYRLKRYEEAVPVFREYLNCLEEIEDEAERTAKLAQAHRMFGVCFFEMDNREEGERETRTAIAIETDARSRLDCRHYLADRYLSFGEYERAVEECDGILAEDENYYPAYLVRQEAFFHLNRAQQVVDDYYRAIGLYAGYDRPYLYAAMIFYNYNQYKDAMGVIERARENKVGFSKKLCLWEAKIRRMLAESEEERQQVVELLDALLYAAEEENGQLKENGAQQADGQPERQDSAEQDDQLDRAELFFEKGLVYEAGEKMEECRQAVACFLKAAEQDETYRDTNLRLYRCYRKLYWAEYKRADYEAAMFYINKQLTLNDNRGYRLWDRGNLYEDALETALAVADYQAALAAGTVPQEEWYILWENIGIAYKADGQFPKAYEAFKRAVEIMPSKDASAKGYQGMAECCYNMGNYSKAIDCCREGLVLFPKDEELWDKLDDCYRMKNCPEKALQVEEERRKQAGDTKAYYAGASYALLAMGKVEAGLALFDEMKRSYLARAADKDEMAELYQEWADHLTEACIYEEGAKKYQEAAALYGEKWKKRFQMEWRTARCYYMIGEREKAASYAKKALACLDAGHIALEDYLSFPRYELLHNFWLAWCNLMLGEKEKAKKVFEEMDGKRPCSWCGCEKCFEVSLWLGCYYYTEGAFDRAAALFEETLRRDIKATEAKYLLEKIKTEMKTEKTDKKGWKGLFRKK